LGDEKRGLEEHLSFMEDRLRKNNLFLPGLKQTSK
jgi:hypothetical protein